MPLYECRCEPCGLTFEVLAPASESRMRSRRCPECGASARRIMSAVSFAVSGSSRTRPEAEVSDPRRPDVTKLKIPPAARLCWMDDQSASRLAAYKHGRGAEYDDTIASREEKAARRGEPASKPEHPVHSHSPLSDPTVLAHRREAAARKMKVIESKKIVEESRAARKP
ncbi:MAG TPA: zinc ribbon domain-containing protein [Candidatus Binataceae bacterium]|nr:zinc ribbon domain-containing protein [Candidatus Binataceae bacterium]